MATEARNSSSNGGHNDNRSNGGKRRKNNKQSSRSSVVVIDGANVAFEEQSENGKPQVKNIVAVRDRLKELGYDPIVIVDASLRHEVADPDLLESLIDGGEIYQVPAGTDADYFVLRTAQQQKAQIVSNDRFNDRRGEFPWVDDRRVPLMIIRGQVQLHLPDLEPTAKS